MTPIEIEHEIAVRLNQAEVKAAEVGVLLAEIDQLSDPAFEANYDATAAAKAGKNLSDAMKANAREKLRLAQLHSAALAAYNTASFPRPRTGK